MRLPRLEEILAAIPRTRVLVLGDFFLDQYWQVDPALAESSIETGLQANQITSARLNPGAAGTVANNLAALGVGEIIALGVIGEDGNGFELLRGLERIRVRTEQMVTSPSRFTPCYTKPMYQQKDGTSVEGERFDLKNRTLTPLESQEEVACRLAALIPCVDAVAVMDQVEEVECGTVTRFVRRELSNWACQSSDLFVLADSRYRIGEFENVAVKPNEYEARQALQTDPFQSPERVASALSALCNGPVIMTRGAQGILLYEKACCRSFPAPLLPGPLDIVGAGDSSSAAIVAARAAGASLAEAVQLAILVASVTVQKLGTTGTATPEEVLEIAHAHREHLRTWEEVDNQPCGASESRPDSHRRSKS